MSVGSSFRRSWNDTLIFSEQSYCEIKDFNFKKIDLKKLSKMKHPSHAIKRMLKNEYKKQYSKYAYKIYAQKPITVDQIKDIYNDIGFNVDAIFSEHHHEDFAIIANLGSMAIPFWRPLLRFIFRKNSSRAKMFLYQLAPGHIRLHSRLFNNNDGSWYIVTHIDGINWFNLNHPIAIIKSHFRTAAGDYKTGNKIMGEILRRVRKSFKEKNSIAIELEDLYREITES